MERAITVLLVLVGVIHLLPVSGVLSAERLSALYGMSFDENNLALLMRHRAILFGLLGAFLVYAAFKPKYQLMALIGGFVSDVSFLWLAWQTEGTNEAIQRIVVADVVALISLVIAAILYGMSADNR